MINIFTKTDKGKNCQSRRVSLLTIAASVIIGTLVSVLFLYFPHSWPAWKIILCISIAVAVFNSAVLYLATNHLCTCLKALEDEMLKREQAKEQTVYNHGERVKELKTLYTVSRILQDEDAATEKLFREIVDVIPLGWQFPDITAACLSVAGTDYTTSNYKSSEYSQRAEMKTAKGTKVVIEVVYLQEKPEIGEGPFLLEERNLINMLVEMLKTDLERRERTYELKDYKHALDIASIVAISNVEGDFIFVNENFCKASKYNSDELLGRHHSIIWSGFHSPEYFEELKIKMQNGKPFQGEFCNKAKDGTLYWVDSTIVPFLAEDGKVYQYLSINQDITKRKNATEFFRYQFENSPDTILIINKDLKIESVNHGRPNDVLSPADYIGRDSIEVLPENSREMAREAVIRCFATGENIEIENEASGNRWMRSRIVPIRIDGQINNIMVIATDIIQQREALEKLRASEERYKSIITVSNTGAWEYHLDNDKVWCSEQYFAMLGIEKPDGNWDDSIASTWIERLHPDDRDSSIKVFDEFLKGGSMGLYENYFRMRHQNGNWVWIWSRAKRLRDKNGKLTNVALGTHIDISERIQAEEKIKESEQLLKRVTSQVPGNTYMFEIEETGLTKTLFFNRGTDEINHSLDLKDAASASQKLLEVLHHDDKILWTEEMKRAYHSHAPISFQYRILLGGHWRWRWFRAIPERTKEGKVFWYGAAQDITPIVDYIASIEQIIFDISHVIRKPISTMMGLTKPIIDNDLSEKDIKEISKKLYAISEEMDTFIRELNVVYNEKRHNTKLNIDVSSLLDKRSSLFK